MQVIISTNIIYQNIFYRVQFFRKYGERII